MDDLRRRFASLDRVPAPDLWDAIERQAAAAGSTTRLSAVVRPVAMRSGRSSRWQLVLLLAVAALLAALVVGAFVSGSLRPDLLAIVVNPSATVVPPETAAPSAAPSASPAPTASTADRPWMTGQELMDVLSADYGYTWTELSIGEGRSSSESGGVSDAVHIRVFSPINSPANVHVTASVDVDPDDLLRQADRVAQALAPDVRPWIRDAIPQGLAAGPPSVATTETAGGGKVGMTVVDEPLLEDWMFVEFALVTDPPPTRTLEPGGSGIVLYAVHNSEGGSDGPVWAVSPDGTDAGLFIPSAATPDGVSEVLGWAADGSRLFYRDGGDVFALDADGSLPVRIGFGRDDPRCPVAGETCEGDEDLAVSPDGSRLAYLIGFNAIGLFDLATGQVTRLAFDSESRPVGPGCEGPPAGGGPLQWSPDGTRFVFGASIGPKVDGWCPSAVFTVNVDGTDLRRVSPPTVRALDPRWSPGGSTIVFTSVTPRSAWEGTTDATRIPIDMDIHSVRPDGSGLTALTSDGRSDDPHWTRDGRIVFIRWDAGPAGVAAASGRGDVRIMDADGQNASALDTTVPAETAAGCLVCPYPDEQGLLSSDSHRFWWPGQP
jgi:hypothetical protein